MGQKRRRLASSCVHCRRRKVKCGRELPQCIRCVRGGQGDSCRYISYYSDVPEKTDHLGRNGIDLSQDESHGDRLWSDSQHSSPSTPERLPDQGQLLPLPTGTKTSTAESSLAQRVFDLETYVRSAGSRPVSSEMFLGLGHPHGPGSRPKDLPQDAERALLRVRAFETRYFGPTNMGSLLLQFQDLSIFIRKVSKRMPNRSKSRAVMKMIRVQTERATCESPGPEPDPVPLHAMIPSRARSDALLELFLEVFETTYRVLHVPSFRQDYEAFWASPETAGHDFVVQLLLVLASVNCIVPGGDSDHERRGATGRETCHRWIETAGIWLAKQSLGDATLSTNQNWILLLVAKLMTCYKVKEYYAASQHLLAMAMAAGFHREPTFLSASISPFDQEMRRRMWYTILELNMELCCDRGIRSSVGPDDWDCLQPLNIHDEDFAPSTKSMPSARPLADFTRVSCLCKLAQHLPLRMEMLARMNSISRTLEFPTAMGFDTKIREQLDSLPRWHDKLESRVARSISMSVLHNFLIMVHQPFATQQLDQSQYFHSRSTWHDSSLRVIRSVTELTELHALALINYREDGFRCILALCHDLAVVQGRHGAQQDANQALELITRGVDLAGLRVKRLSQGVHGFWLCSNALGLASSRVAPKSVDPEEFVLSTVNRVVDLHTELLPVVRCRPSKHPSRDVVGMSGMGHEDETTVDIQQAPLPVNGTELPLLDPMSSSSGAMFDFGFDLDDNWDWWDLGFPGPP
jgi:hypothetical protein